MTQHTDSERAEFEAWACDRYPSIDLTRDGGDYSKALAKDYWSLWQAARRAPVAPPPPSDAPQGWTPVSERLPDFMVFCDWLMPMTDAKRERWILANESMVTASVPGLATHWRKAQALPELTAHQPPVVNDSLTTDATVNQGMTVQVPPFTTLAQHKLDDLLAQGFRITGYAIERTDVADWAPQRGFVTHGGLVGWWTPHQIDRIPGAQHGQPT